MISREEALILLKVENVPDNVMKHTLMVNKIANYIADEMVAMDIDVDLELVDVGSLLHDVGRGRSHKGHTEIGVEIMEELEENEIARIVKSHSMDCFTADFGIEDKIVHYADKRVKHDEIVSLDDRMNDLMERYPHNVDNFNTVWPKLRAFEDDIFEIIGEEKGSLVCKQGTYVLPN